MSTKTLLHIGHYNLSEQNRRELRDACSNTIVIETDGNAPLEQIDGSEIDFLVTELIPENLQAWPRLRFIQLFSAGINHLKNHPVWQTDIAIANSSGIHSVPIAQYVTCAVLMMAHRMPEITLHENSRRWARIGFECSIVRGKTVGIIGYGSIGRECARQLSALGMHVVCLKRNPDRRRDDGYSAWPDTGDPEGTIPERWFGPSQLREMIPLCDVMVITVPSTDETFDVISKAELALMKSSATLINIARGGIVNEEALVEALRNRQIAGAMIDCFVKEPIPTNHPFFNVPNIILTPHMSGVFDTFWPVMATLLRENLRRFAAGEPILNRVNAKLGY